MISIYFREGDTRIAKGKLLKNNHLQITDVSSSTDSYFSAISDPEASPVQLQLLQSFFTDVQKSTRGDESVYIILPDYIFNIVECIEVASDEEVPNKVQELARSSIDSLYWKVPTSCEPMPTVRKKTIVGIDKSIIQRIVDIAGEAGLKISSIEPFCTAFLRGYGIFHEERIIMEVTKNYGDLISYSPIGGFTKIQIPNLPIEKLAKQPEPETVIKEAMLRHDAMAVTTFRSSNDNIPVIIQSEAGGGVVEKSLFLKERNDIAATTFRKYSQSITFAGYIESEISSDAQEEWIANAGTLLQSVSSEKLLEMAECPSNFRIHFDTANLLPDDVVINSKFWHWQQRMFKTFKVAIVGLAAVAAAEFFGFLYFSNVSVPEGLVQQYESAQKESKGLESEFNMLKQAEKEDQHPMDAYLEILKYRPSSCRFLSMKIGGQEGSNKSGKWISLSAVAKEPVAFQNMIAELSKSEMFKNVHMEKLDDQAGVGYKSATFSISKGKLPGKGSN